MTSIETGAAGVTAITQTTDTAARRARFVGFTPPQRREYRALLTTWMITVAGFLTWWLQPAHRVSWGHLIFSTALLLWTVGLPIWFLGFAGRARRPSRTIDPPPGRVAMVVTKAPSEPWPVVMRTLEGCLAQRHPHDTWLADEQPDDETLAWCADHGVEVCSRFGVEDYHRPTWPRRTRCKEGNLAYFYDTVGYRSYDFVVQLDADHVPTAGYLTEMLRPFSDSDVGYVSASSICDANADRSWAVRARAFAEAPMHGALQAGANGGFAPMCIGSHYAVRTRALRDVGGLGPELAEDHSTTLLLNAAGWRGAHAVDAIAHGDGPESFADLMVQEFQWSRSLVNLLFGLTPKTVGTMPLRLRAQFLFSQLWYPLYALVMLASVVAPLVALATGTPWMRIPYIPFLGGSLLLTSLLMAIVGWLKDQRLFRPVDAPVLSWEAGLFQVVRWPWVLIGTLASVADTVHGSAFPFRVTAKGSGQARPLPLRMIAPHLIVALVSGLGALLIDAPPEVRGYYWFAVANAGLYSAAVAAVLWLHWRENRDRQGRRRPVVHTAAVAATGVLALVACTDRADDMTTALTWTGERAPELANPTAPLDLSDASVNLGIYDFTGTFDGSDRFAIHHEFVDWLDHDESSVRALATEGTEQGRWPLLTVEPQPRPGGEDTLLADVAAGTYDDRISAMCRGLTDIGTPAFVRWGHEMEVPSERYPWAGQDPAEFVDAFRHVESVCRGVLGDDLFMVWSPRGDEGLADYWPGADHVDVVGLSLFDFPAYFASIGVDPDLSFEELLAPKYNRVRDFGRPVLIAEMGTTRTDTDKRTWLQEALDATSDYPLLQTIVFFDAPDTEGVYQGVQNPVWSIERALLPDGDVLAQLDTDG